MKDLRTVHGWIQIVIIIIVITDETASSSCRIDTGYQALVHCLDSQSAYMTLARSSTTP